MVTQDDPLTSLFIVNTVCPGVSMCCGLLMLIAWCKRKQGGRFEAYWDLIKWISITDICAAVGDFLIWCDYQHVDAGSCLASAFVTQWFDWASVAWVGCVAHYMQRTICYPRHMTRAATRRLQTWYHSVVWGSSTLLAST